MLRSLYILCLFTLLPWNFSRAQEPVKPSGSGPAIDITDGSARYTEAQLARVGEWINNMAPSYPSQLVLASAERILDDLGMHHRTETEAMLAGGGNVRKFESLVLRHMAAVLVGPQHGELRDALARQRVVACLGAMEPDSPAPDAQALLGKLKTTSQVQYRRVAEGKVEDDELLVLLRKARGDAPRVERKLEPKVATAGEIASEFSRRNQVGSSVERLQAYTIEATLQAAEGEIQQIVLHRMRPDRFRFALQSGGLTRQIISSSGRGYWVQSPGQPSKPVTPEALGDLVHLAEFVNPLMRQEGYTLTKLADGDFDQRPVFRIKILRPDGSGYESCIDKESYREIAREHPDGAVTRFSDFREVAGITFAFREELTDAKKRKAVVEVKRLKANHGIVQTIFEAPESGDYFRIERLLAETAQVGKGSP